ncbi:Flagellar hook-basal body complex protein FliE [hydrothermal vent metagenome]|uniref:Flagellar hook-basal body complex protein FliE n=1 Tax=hydrothermal vent metagenome TaxID=652676 RepID=A0A3B0XDN0_9ZZZZ
MSDIEINQVLQQMRNMASVAENKLPVEAGTEVAKPDFSQLLKDSINQVNQIQKSAGGMATAFEAGDPAVSLSEVMVAIQKAGVSFQAMTQVRNNLVSAYKEVMNMPV